MSSISIYSEIKDQVDTRKAAELYGFKVSWNGMMCCPFHDDKTPSMKVDKNFFCFGCGEKGDVIRFVSLLFNLKPYDAAMKLVDDMRLTVTVPERFPFRPNWRKKTVTKPELKITEKQRFEKLVDRLYSVYVGYYRLLNEWAELYAPSSPENEIHPLFLEALTNRSYVEFILDVLHGREDDKKKIIVMKKGKNIDELEKQLQKYKKATKEYCFGEQTGVFGGESHSRYTEKPGRHEER